MFKMFPSLGCSKYIHIIWVSEVFGYNVVIITVEISWKLDVEEMWPRNGASARAKREILNTQ